MLGNYYMLIVKNFQNFFNRVSSLESEQMLPIVKQFSQEMKVENKVHFMEAQLNKFDGIFFK